MGMQYMQHFYKTRKHKSKQTLLLQRRWFRVVSRTIPPTGQTYKRLDDDCGPFFDGQPTDYVSEPLIVMSYIIFVSVF